MMMGSVCAGIGWTARQFWQSTPHEVCAIMEAKEAVNDGNH